MMKIVVTGATGMLGRAVMDRFSRIGDFEPVGICHSRRHVNAMNMDLCDAAAVTRILDVLQPRAIVHTAAIRNPDEFAANEEAARRLNVEATRTLAKWAGEHGRYMMYISSDYVFDGTAAPYPLGSMPKPANAYGQSKYEGEVIVRKECYSCYGILRVPVLYGEKVETLAESSVTSVVGKVLDFWRGGANGKLVLDDWAVRYPTDVADVAKVLEWLVRFRYVGTYHWSGLEAMTKLDMGVVTAKFLGLDPSLLVGSGAPANGSEKRPKDCHLDRSVIEEKMKLDIYGAPMVVPSDVPFVEMAKKLLARFR